MKNKQRLLNYFCILAIVIALYVRRQSFDVRVISANASLPNDSSQIERNPVSAIAQAEKLTASDSSVRSKIKIDNLSEDQLLYCEIAKTTSQVELAGQLKMQVFSYDDDGAGQSGKTVMLRSDRCPIGTYSMIKLDGLGRLKEAVDCRIVRSEFLEINAGVQGNVKEVPDTKSTANIAISGDGFFVLRCPNNFKLMRSGKFHRIESKLVSTGDCTVLNRDGSDFVANAELNEYGCDSLNNCIAIAQPKFLENIRLNRPRELETTENVSGWILTNPRVFTNSLEELTEIAGPDWDSIPDLKVPDCDNQSHL